MAARCLWPGSRGGASFQKPSVRCGEPIWYYPRLERPNETYNRIIRYMEEHINERRLFQEAEQRNLLIMPGFLFYPEGYEGAGHVRLSYSNISDEDIEKGVQILSEALERSAE